MSDELKQQCWGYNFNPNPGTTRTERTTARGYDPGAAGSHGQSGSTTPPPTFDAQQTYNDTLNKLGGTNILNLYNTATQQINQICH